MNAGLTIFEKLEKYSDADAAICLLTCDDMGNCLLYTSRYLVPNIYNSNDYNLEVEGEVYGLPNNNLGMNAKKPFLSSRTKKIEVPFLLNKEEVLLQKQFFDHLMNYAMAGKSNVYIDTVSYTHLPTTRWHRLSMR